MKIGQEARHLEGVGQVRLAGEADLSPVHLGAVDVGLPDEVEVLFRQVGLEFSDDVFEADHVRFMDPRPVVSRQPAGRDGRVGSVSRVKAGSPRRVSGGSTRRRLLRRPWKG